MLNYFEFFEKNILDDVRKLEMVLFNDPSIIKDYVKHRLSIEGDQALDSTAFRKIFDLYKEGMKEDHRMRSYYFKSDYKAKMYSVESDKFMFFNQFEMFYLLTGKNFFEVGEDRQEILIDLFLSEDRTYFTSPVTPIVFKNAFAKKDLDAINNAFEFKVPEDETIEEYFRKNAMLLEQLPEEKIKQGFLHYLETNKEDPAYGFFSLFNNHISPSFDYDLYKMNKININKMLRIFWEIVIEKGLDYIASRPSNVDLEDLEEGETHEDENLKLLCMALFQGEFYDVFGDHFFKHAPKIIDLIIKLNAFEGKVKDNSHYYTLNIPDDLLIGVLMEVKERGVPFYLADVYGMSNSKPKASFKYFVEVKDQLVIRKGDIQEVIEMFEVKSKLSNHELTSDNISQMTSYKVFITLSAIFGEILKEEKESISIYQFLNKEKNTLFEKETKKRTDGKEITRYVRVTEEGLKSLLEFKENN